jgi:hypothetical protein
MLRWLVLLLVMVAGCSDAAESARTQAVDEARARLESDPAQALRVAKSALAEHGADPRLSLVAGLAHLRLEQRSEAIAQADAGLAVEDLPADLHADLSWVRGAGLMSRFRELSSQDDWRAANTALEDATEAGTHRAEAATALVFLQELGPLGTPERQLRFGRLLLQLAPESPAAARVRELLEAKGLTP